MNFSMCESIIFICVCMQSLLKRVIKMVCSLYSLSFFSLDDQKKITYEATSEHCATAPFCIEFRPVQGSGIKLHLHFQWQNLYL